MESGLHIIKPLQEGGQARVYLCMYQDRPIVLKVYKSASGSALERELSAGLRIKAKSSGQGHSRIVALQCSQPISVAEDGSETPALTFEVGHCDLLEYLETTLGSGRGLGDSSATKTWFKDVLSALVFCHSAGVAHLDVRSASSFNGTTMHASVLQIKPENIILCPGEAGADGSPAPSVAKLADFGTALIQESDSFGEPQFLCQKVVGSPHYAAPEIVELRKALARRKKIAETAATRRRNRSPLSWFRRNSNSSVVPINSGAGFDSPLSSQGSASNDSELNANPTWGWSSASQSTQSAGALTTSGSYASAAAGSGGSDLDSQTSPFAAGGPHGSGHVGSPLSIASGEQRSFSYDAFAADVWSFGVALYVGTTGRWPFGTADFATDKAFQAFLTETNQNHPDAFSDTAPTVESVTQTRSSRWKWPRVMGSELRQVIEMCLQCQPHRRPTAEQLLSHAWFK